MDYLTERAITMLRREGRASYNEIARRLGTNRMNIATRLGPLFENGSLRVIAAVHPRLLGLEVLAHVSIRASGATDRIAGRLATLPSPVFVSEITGPWQLIAELHTVTMADLQEQLRRIRALPGVLDLNVLLYEHLLASFFLGEEPTRPAHSLDATDLAVIEQLQQDGRLGYAELGRRVGLSTGAARGRVARLLDSGTMQIGVMHGRDAAGAELVFGFGITLAGDQQPTIDLLLAEPGTELLARTVGRFDLVATITFTTLRDFNALLGRLRALDRVQLVEPWLHARIHHEQYHRDAFRRG